SSPAESQPDAAPAREPRRFVTADQLETLREELAAGRDRLAPLIEAVDVGPAQTWLDASPLEQLTERVADPALDEAQKAGWQSAVDNEQAASERIRGALGRAELALASRERVDELESRLDAMLAELTPVADQEERPLTRIEEHIA